MIAANWESGAVKRAVMNNCRQRIAMKTTIVAFVAWAAVLAFIPSSRGQSDFTVDVGPVTYALSNVPPGKQGQPVDNTFFAQLFVGPAGAIGLSQMVPLGPTAAFANDGTTSLSPILGLPGGTVTWAVVAWEGSGPYGEGSYNLNPTTPVIQGSSAIYSYTIPGGPPPIPPRFGPITFTVEIVPEPSVLAIVGLGVVVAMTRRCRAWRS
jgi:hypothetical protein